MTALERSIDALLAKLARDVEASLLAVLTGGFARTLPPGPASPASPPRALAPRARPPRRAPRPPAPEPAPPRRSPRPARKAVDGALPGQLALFDDTHLRREVAHAPWPSAAEPKAAPER